jgi:hypothetical protein
MLECNAHRAGDAFVDAKSQRITHKFCQQFFFRFFAAIALSQRFGPGHSFTVQFRLAQRFEDVNRLHVRFWLIISVNELNAI